MTETQRPGHSMRVFETRNSWIRDSSEDELRSARRRLRACLMGTYLEWVCCAGWRRRTCTNSECSIGGDRILLEADPRHQGILIREPEQEVRRLCTPGVKFGRWKDVSGDIDETPWAAAEAHSLRPTATFSNYLAKATQIRVPRP